MVYDHGSASNLHYTVFILHSALLRRPDVQRDPRRYLQAVQKVIACMTLGIDVSKLFSEMIMVCALCALITASTCELISYMCVLEGGAHELWKILLTFLTFSLCTYTYLYRGTSKHVIRTRSLKKGFVTEVAPPPPVVLSTI